MLRTIRRLLFLLFVLAIGAIGPVLWWMHAGIDEQVRAEVERMLGDTLSGCQVTVGSARVLAGEGIEIRSVQCRSEGDSADEEPFLVVDELFLHCSTDLGKLVAGNLDIRKVTFRRPHLRAIYHGEGHWNIDPFLSVDFWTLPWIGPELPQFAIEGASIEVLDQTAKTPGRWVLRDGRLSVVPRWYRIQADERPQQGFDLAGAARGDGLGGLRLEASLVPTAQRAQGELTIDGLELTPEFLAALPLPEEWPLEDLPDLRAMVECHLKADYNGQRSRPLMVEVNGGWHRGTVHDERLPAPIRDCLGRFVVHADGVRLEGVQGKLGDATFQLAGDWQGFDPTADGRFQGSIRNLLVDHRFVAALPHEIRDTLEAFDPSGIVQVTFDLRHRQGGWQPECTVLCENLAFTYSEFDYRMTGTVGTLKVADGQLHVDLISHMGSRPVRIAGELGPLGPHPRLHGTVIGENVAIDRVLIEAFRPEIADALRKLNPSGLVDFRLTLDRPAGPNQWLRLDLETNVRQTSINYDKYPYPLSRLSGSILATIFARWHPDGEVEQRSRWTIRDVTASNGTGVFRFSGAYDSADEASGLRIQVSGEQIALDEELRGAMPPIVVEAWDELRPQGRINLVASIRYLEDQPPKVSLAVEPDGVSIRAKAFPYRIEDLRGTIRLEDNRVWWHEVTGRHRGVRMVGSGLWTAEADRWRLRLTDVRADRLRFGPNAADPELWMALPQEVRQALESLNFAGVVNFRGDVEISGALAPQAPVELTWDVALDCRQTSISQPVPMTDIYGTVRLRGRANPDRAEFDGDLDLDTVDFQGLQLTRIRGPFSYHPGQITFGSVDALRAAPGWPVPPDRRRVTGRVVGGRFVLDAAVALGETPRYRVRWGLVDADLSQYAREALPGRSDGLRGQLVAELDLSGTGTGTHGLSGTGRVSPRNGHLYELPQAVTLLSVLTLRPSDRPDLSDGDLDFRIAGPYVYFDTIDLRGDAISLRGAGSMGLSGEVDLQFFTIPGRDEYRLPVVSRMLAGASQQLLRIDVTGTLDEPSTQRKLVPVASDSLQQYFRDLQGRRRVPQPNRPTPWVE